MFMRPLMTAIAASLLCAVALAGCGTDEQTTDSDTPSKVADADVTTWGGGGYGVVLAHGAAFDAASWEDQAIAIADTDATVVAVEDISTESLRAAVESLQIDGISDVALVGGSAGADAILALAAAEPELGDQLILISPNTTQELSGGEPKLFVASEDEPVADVSTQLAESSAGDDNVVELLPGSAHAQNIFDTDQGDVLLELILARLGER